MSSILTLRDVTKVYGRTCALRIHTLDLRDGASVVLRGSNGSGKSTLLRILAGVSVPTSGAVTRDRERLGSRLGFVPQVRGLHSDLSIEQNMVQRRRLYGQEPDDALMEKLLTAADLGDVRKRRFAELSGGLQRLAAMTAVLYVEPTWLLVDEPFAGVDRRRRAEMERLLEQSRATTRLLVVTSPESEEHFPFTTQSIVLRNGSLHEG